MGPNSSDDQSSTIGGDIEIVPIKYIEIRIGLAIIIENSV